MAEVLRTPVPLPQVRPGVLGAASWRSRATAQWLFVVPVVFALWTLGPSLWFVVASEAGARLLTRLAVAAGLFAWTRDVVGQGIDASAERASGTGFASIRLVLAQPVLLVTAAALALGAAPGIRTSVMGLVVLGGVTVLRRTVAAETPQARRGILRSEVVRVALLAILSVLAFTELGGVAGALVGLPDDRGVLAVASLGYVAVAISGCIGNRGGSRLPVNAARF